MISPDQHPDFRLCTLSIASLLSFLLLISPMSLFSQDSSPPSADFNGNGVVDIPDFLLFVDVFGSKEGQERYESKYDLDGNDEIGIPDFLIFVDNFGKAVTRDEPTAAVPSNVVVEEGDSKLTVRWDAVLDEEGKPSVTGYEVRHRERDAEDSVEWAVGEPTSSRLDTSVTIMGVLNGQAYLVSVRTLVDGGGSEWPSPVLGIPVIPAAGPIFLGGGGRGGTSPPPPPPPSSVVTIPDANLRAVIENRLGKARGAPITKDEMSTLTYLQAHNANISDLTGLEFATRLTNLNFNDNRISDISLLSGLTNLEQLYLGGNGISAISPLSSLTKLEWLYLKHNRISDISLLSGLTKLEWLYLSSNSISDISSLSGLTKLLLLVLDSNNISNISSLSGLTNLVGLDLESNRISDISSLSGLTKLAGLYLSSNKISDISSLSGLTKLEKLFLDNNGISDISSLSDLTKLEKLLLNSNSISDISSLSGLTKLEKLLLNSNSISDISPLVENMGLGSGDTVDVSSNPLSTTSLNTHIPTLKSRGVSVNYE